MLPNPAITPPPTPTQTIKCCSLVPVKPDKYVHLMQRYKCLRYLNVKKMYGLSIRYTKIKESSITSHSPANFYLI